MRLFLLMILAIFAAPLHADVRGDVYHDVRIDIREGDRVIGQPHFIMADNGVATITSAKPDGYALKVTLAPAPNGRADMRKSIP